MTEKEYDKFTKKIYRSMRIREFFLFFFASLFILGFVASVVLFKYWVWVAAHPSAPLWAFFLGGR